MEQKSNEQKAREIVGFVLNPKCANGSNGLGLLNTHNQRNADLNNINKCSEEIAMRAMELKDKEWAERFKKAFEGLWRASFNVDKRSSVTETTIVFKLTDE